MGKEHPSSSEPHLSEKLPEPIRTQIGIFGLSRLMNFWDRETGQPDSFLRRVMRKIMEDEGRIPPNSDSNNTEGE